MNSKEIFTLGLNLNDPWYVKEVTLEIEESKITGRIDIYIDFKKGHKFIDKNGKETTAYDTISKEWKHLNFFQHECYIHARVPRIKTGDKEINIVQVPWAREGSGFTLLFESMSMIFIESEMPVIKAAKLMNVHDTMLWRIFNFWINKAIKEDDQSDIKSIGIDETSTKKGHKYVTLAVDMETKRVVFATKGKGSECIDNLKQHLESKGCKSEQIENASIDMSPAFISGITKNFTNASITFDKFHIVKIINEAMDNLRKIERKEIAELKGHKYIFLKHNKDLTIEQQEMKEYLLSTYPRLGEAYRFKELFQDFWEIKDVETASTYLAYWCDLVEESNITPFIQAVKTIKSHWDGIINHIKTRLNNGILEGINSKIQLAKKRARGYRNIDNFISMIYFIAGKLQMNYNM